MAETTAENLTNTINSEPNLVVITGLSGAGRTEAMHAFEDRGYFCIDNLPPSLLINLVNLAGLNYSLQRRLAVVCDIRSREFFADLVNELRAIRESGINVKVIFLDSRDDVLLSRYKASRRRHPLANDALTISAAINQERILLQSVRNFADTVIDTSEIAPRELRLRIYELFNQISDQRALAVTICSFGFKFGLPIESDLVIDVRFLPNPFYIPELRSQTGLDAAVQNYVLDSNQTQGFLAKWQDLLDVVMPGYVAEGKQQLLISIGCTGGQHRSVTFVNLLYEALSKGGQSVVMKHRDII